MDLENKKADKSKVYMDIPAFYNDSKSSIWWSWGDLNPRPEKLSLRPYTLSQSLNSPRSCGMTRHFSTILNYISWVASQAGVAPLSCLVFDLLEFPVLQAEARAEELSAGY